MINRIIDFAIAQSESCFLWGPRQTGKSTLLHAKFPGALFYDMLLASNYRRFLTGGRIVK